MFFICMSFPCSRMPFECTHTSLVCHLYVLACHSHVTQMYLYVIRLSLVYTRMSLLCTCISLACHSYVLSCHSCILVCYPYAICSYGIRMCLYVTSEYSYVICMSHVCGFTMNQIKYKLTRKCFSLTSFELIQIKSSTFTVCPNISEVKPVNKWLANEIILYRKKLI